MLAGGGFHVHSGHVCSENLSPGFFRSAALSRKTALHRIRIHIDQRDQLEVLRQAGQVQVIAVTGSGNMNRQTGLRCGR